HHSCMVYDEKVRHQEEVDQLAEEAEAMAMTREQNTPGILKGEATSSCAEIVLDRNEYLEFVLPIHCNTYSWKRIMIKVGCMTKSEPKYLIPLRGKPIDWKYLRAKGQTHTDQQGRIHLHHLNIEDPDPKQFQMTYQGVSGKPDPKTFTWELPADNCGIRAD
ncbi:MAG: hypothetical protein KDD43_09250, partial [Bdellovibrionales bacterium]|nr:hypothetical protein [Bdellovibrionales bacterium]